MYECVLPCKGITHAKASHMQRQHSWKVTHTVTHIQTYSHISIQTFKMRLPWRLPAAASKRFECMSVKASFIYSHTYSHPGSHHKHTVTKSFKDLKCGCLTAFSSKFVLLPFLIDTNGHKLKSEVTNFIY